MTIAAFDHFPAEKKKELLKQCCGSDDWVNKMLTVFPVEDLVELLEAAEEKWYECNEENWKEAFEHHPKIGDINSLKEKFGATADWVEDEQSRVKDAEENILHQLAKVNEEYQDKFGFIFIVCATGKAAEDILSMLQSRFKNTRQDEIKIAASEQNKITKIRLEKLFA